MDSTAKRAKVYGESKPKNVWESICHEFAHKKRLLETYDENVAENLSTTTVATQYSAGRHTPVVYGHMVHETFIDVNVGKDFDPSIGHPAALGLCLLTRPDKPTASPSKPPPNPKTCTPTEYLEAYVFPALLPVIGEMLDEAKQRKCFEKRRFGFQPCDFVTEFLYKNNHNIGPQEKEERKEIDLFDIPFVSSWLLNHPRPPLPLSLVWTDDEAAVKIQAFYRGYRVRIRGDVAELRQWQRQWREENGDIRKKVEEFWVEAETRAASEAMSAAASAAGRRSRCEKVRTGSS